jgi:hypothetical protein
MRDCSGKLHHARRQTNLPRLAITSRIDRVSVKIREKTLVCTIWHTSCFEVNHAEQNDVHQA